jgi:hypothetical protein
VIIDKNIGNNQNRKRKGKKFTVKEGHKIQDGGEPYVDQKSKP